MRNLAIALGAAAIFGATGSFAVDLKNEDNKRYDIKLYYDARTTGYTLIEAKTTRAAICEACKIEVKGVGTIEAKGGELVVVKDGKIRIEQ